MRKWIDIASEQLDEADLPFGSEYDCWIDDTGKKHMLDRTKRQTHRHKAAELFNQPVHINADYNNEALQKGWVRVYCHDHRAAVEMTIGKVTRQAIRATIDFVRRTHDILQVSVEDTGYSISDEYREPKDAEKLLGRIMLKSTISSLFDDAFNSKDVLSEKYSRENVYLLHHLNNGSIDYYQYWWVITQWIEHEDLTEELSERAGREIDNLHDEEPELFELLTPTEQASCEEWVVTYLMRHDPAEAPTGSYFTPEKRLIPRTTWLIHFSDHASDIWTDGFTRGVNDMNRLGLTTHLGDQDKKYGGYNFAFRADGRDASWAAAKRSYGSEAVMFQNSGVSAWHSGDEEQQIIFWGADVAKDATIYLSREEGDWVVNGRDDSQPFRGDLKSAVAWVMRNDRQYARVLHSS